MSLSGMIHSSATAAVITNPRLPDNPIIECNDAFTALTGYRRDEVLGQNCRFLTGSGTETALVEQLRDGIHARRPTMVEILNYKKDGTAFRNAVLVAPIFGKGGHLEYFLGSQAEIGIEASSAAALRRKHASSNMENLSPRQREVVVKLASGKLIKQIAFELGLGERTVKMHRATVLQTLGLKSTADIIRLAIEAGF